MERASLKEDLMAKKNQTATATKKAGHRTDARSYVDRASKMYEKAGSPVRLTKAEYKAVVKRAEAAVRQVAR
jgi:hypothetical protein